jgi:hypothetical protein
MSGKSKKRPVPRRADAYLSDFVLASGEPGYYPCELPNSCIESAEYAIQVYHRGEKFKWVSGRENDPHVWAIFGDGVEVDITSTQLLDFAQGKGDTLKDYNFNGSLPGLGEGLILLHKRDFEAKVYHMHLAAVLAQFPDSIVISKMAESLSLTPKMATPKVEEISSTDEFRTRWFPDNPGDYAIGLLRAKTIPGAQAGLLPTAANSNLRRSKRNKL